MIVLLVDTAERTDRQQAAADRAAQRVVAVSWVDAARRIVVALPTQDEYFKRVDALYAHIPRGRWRIWCAHTRSDRR